MYEFDLSKEQRVIDRLLEGPAVVRYRTLVELSGRGATDPEVVRARRSARDSKEVQGLLGNRSKDSAGGRPEWWGAGPEEYEGLKLQPWMFKILAEAGLSRGDEEVRKAAEVCLDLQNPDGSFGKLEGVERVQFTAEVTYALSLLGYGRSGDLRNALRWLFLWLKANWPVRLAGEPGGPGRLLLEALAHFEPFTVSELSQAVLKSLFVGKRTVLTSAVSSSGVRIGSYDGFLTWGELGFAIGWPRTWEAPYEVMALLSSCRNRDGMWGQGGSDFAETLRALKLWRELTQTYGGAPEGFQYEVPKVTERAPVAAGGGGGGRPARGKGGVRANGGAKTNGGARPEDSTTRRRHVRVFAHAGLEDMANEVVRLLGEFGYAADWRGQDDVQLKAEGKSCTFRLRVETTKGPGGDENDLVLTALGCSPKVNLKHWSRVLGLGSRRGRASLTMTQGGSEGTGQARVGRGSTDRRALSKLGGFLSQLIGSGMTAAKTGPAPAGHSGPKTGRSRRGRRRRPRGGTR